jgi:hypothetical protein
MTTLQPASFDRASGVTLIIGSIGLIVTMMIHPSGPELFIPGQMSHVIRIGIVAHSIAVCSIPILFLAALGFSLRIRPSGILPIAALVVFGLASVAIMNAAIFSGLVATEIAGQIVAPNVDPSWRMAFHFNGQLNQAFALVYILGSPAAVLLWSIWMLRSSRRSRGVFIYRKVLAPLIFLATISGRIRLDVHGFGAIALSQTIWFIGVGIWLRQPPLIGTPGDAQ